MESKKTAIKNQKKKLTPTVSFNKLLLLPLVVIVAIIYLNSINNQIINTWDDHGYISENKDMQSMHSESVGTILKKTFSTYVLGNYHPITMLTYSMEYSKFKSNPKPYHVTNLLLHIINTLLVFCFIWLLTQQQWVAFITALLFGIHPMHVESVAWISERKDVLYTLFSLGSMCAYLLYLKQDKRQRQFYVLAVFLFLLALLSKAMAASIAVAFFAIDYFLDRKFTVKTIVEKIPFLVLALILGIVAIGAQKSASALDGIVNYTFWERISFGCYALMTYLWKLLIPMGMSCFYSYPEKVNGSYPFVYSIAPFVVLIIAFLVFKSKNWGKDMVFGFIFFFITIALVLQFLPIGDAILADRYTYIPYIGLFFILARFINNVFENKYPKLQSLKIPLIISITAFSVICCYLTIQRCNVWHDSISLWGDAIEKCDRAPKSFNNRGLTYFETQQYEKALSDFDRTILLRDDYPDIHYNRGVVYYSLKRYDEAIQDYNIALKQNPKFSKAYNNRGNVYHLLGKYNEAIADYNSSIEYNPQFGKAYCDRAGTYFTIQKYKEALADASKALELGYNVDSRFMEAIQSSINATTQQPIK
jgi:Tfp pilus assembly protein PilF